MCRISNKLVLHRIPTVAIEKVQNSYSSCAAKSSSMAGHDIAACLLKVSSRGVRPVTRLVPLATACSKMLLSSLFFGAGCWLCLLFSPFRTDHRKQLRTRSVATQQRLRTNSFAPHRGAPTPLIPHTYVFLWACNRLRRCGTNIGKIMMTVRLTCTFSSSGPV